jgi:hypothetical protein
MGVILEALEIIFEMERKRSNENITRREVNFPSYKTCVFPFFLFRPLLLSNLITF